jgi:hypothetical protein
MILFVRESYTEVREWACCYSKSILDILVLKHEIYDAISFQ